MATEVLWDGFDGKKLYAERAVCDEIGRNIVETYAVRDDVPSVYNAKLKLQLGNGEPADTGFTANASSDATLVVPLMGGATELANGTAGLVPAATSADAGKCLKGDGTWGDLVSYTTVDVYNAEVHGGIAIETRDGGAKVAVIDQNAEYVPPFTATVQSVEVTRSYTVGKMATTWFPFSFKASELTNARLFVLNSITYDAEHDDRTVTEDNLTELSGDNMVVAGTPYVIVASESTLAFNFTGDVPVDTTEMHTYYVPYVTANRSTVAGGTFTPVNPRIDRFGDLPGWDNNRYYGFTARSSESHDIGVFARNADTAYAPLFRAYLVIPND